MIYLDNHATTQCDQRVVQAMLPFFSTAYGNPSSEIHAMGREARLAVETARLQVAGSIGAKPEEIIFTSGATESNNLCILGIAAKADLRSKRRIITSAVEHKSVQMTCQMLGERGLNLVVLPVDASGRVRESIALEQITDETLLASIQAANNEIGTIQQIRQFADMVHHKDALFHCDAAQAIGRISVDVDAWDVDLLSLSAHKVYGPKGIGAVYVRGGANRAPFKSLLYGGDQEGGLRPGTLNVPLIVGFGEACRIAAEVMTDESVRIKLMRDWLEAGLLAAIPDLKRNGDLINRLPNNSSLTFPGVDAEALIMSIPELALSTGSACNSGAQEPSYVLRAIGLTHEQAQSSLRIGLGRFTTDSDIETAITLISERAKAIIA